LYNAPNEAWRQFQRLTTGNIHHQKKAITLGLTAEKTAIFWVAGYRQGMQHGFFGLPITGMPGIQPPSLLFICTISLNLFLW